MIDWRSALRIIRNLTSRDPRPVSMQINITGRCPCRCWHCEKAVHRDGVDLPWNLLMDYLDLAADWNCTVLYTGGEPLVFSRWRDLLREGARRGLAQKLITCGATFPAMGGEDWGLLADTLTELLISLDSSDPSTHDRLRGRSGLFAGIEEFLETRLRPAEVWLVHVPQPDLSTVTSMLELAARHQVGLVVQPYIFASNYPDLAVLDAKVEMRKHLPQLAEQAKRRAASLAREAACLGVVTNLEEVALFIGEYYKHSIGDAWYGQGVLPRMLCSIPWQNVTVDERGSLQPCVFLAGEPAIGAGSPADQWRTQALKFRELQLSGKIWPECHSCSCHFGSNFRNSLLMHPWANRSAWGIALRKRFHRKRSAIARRPRD